MSERFLRGLVVGKFCPLHRGHQLLIQRAVDTCDEVLVISYTKPGFDGCGRTERERWIRGIFPQVTALVVDDAALQALCVARAIAPVLVVPHDAADEEEHRQFCGWLCLSVLKTTVQAVFTSEDYGDGFAASLTAYFRRHAQADAVVRHVSVDQPRRAIGVSGTAVRADVHGHRAMLAPQVYASFVRKVCLLGGESCGKSTLAAALAQRLGTVWVAEYGRQLWELRASEGRQLTLPDMLRIGQTQCEHERQMALQAWRWLVCDTAPLTTYCYSLQMFGQADPALLALTWQRYDAVLVCAPDFLFVQDGTRRDEAFRQCQHAWYLDQLAQRGIGYTLLEGRHEARLDSAVRALEALPSTTPTPPVHGLR